MPLDEVSSEQRRYRQGDQLRPDLRHERVRPGAATSASSARTAQTYIERYFARYPGRRSATWTRRARAARERGYVETVFGRRLWLPEINSGAPVRARRPPSAQAINAPMQGTAADLIKLAMIAVQELARRASGWRRKLIMQVHDELVFEVPEAELEAVTGNVRELMQSVSQARGAAGRRGRRRRNWDKAH